MQCQHQRDVLERLANDPALSKETREVAEGSATAKALDYSLGRSASSRMGPLPVDNSWIESPIRWISSGTAHWRFAGSLRADPHAAALMSLVPSARDDPYACLKGVLNWLPAHKAWRVEVFLSNR